MEASFLQKVIILLTTNNGKKMQFKKNQSQKGHQFGLH